MKKRNLLAFLALIVVVLLFVGCDKKISAVSIEKFKSMADERGLIAGKGELVVTLLKEDEDFSYIEDAAVFATKDDADSLYALYYIVCDNEDNAKKFYEKFLSNTENSSKIKIDDSKTKKLEGKNYNVTEISCVDSGSEWKEKEFYEYFARVENTFLFGRAISGKTTDLKTFIKEMGYPLP